MFCHNIVTGSNLPLRPCQDPGSGCDKEEDQCRDGVGLEREDGERKERTHCTLYRIGAWGGFAAANRGVGNWRKPNESQKMAKRKPPRLPTIRSEMVARMRRSGPTNMKHAAIH